MPSWDNETDYPVYHDVFYCNPDVRSYIVGTLTGTPLPAEPVITPRQLVELLRFLDGDILNF